MTGRATFRLTLLATADIRQIMRHTLHRFGTTQQREYAALLRHALQRAAELPDRPGTKDSAAVFPGTGSYAVKFAARRQAAAVHVIFYRRTPQGILVLRVLHEAMDHARHFAAQQ